jgi:hypothetical protein
MTLTEFCTNLAKLQLSQWQQAIAVLWYHDENQPDVMMSAGQLAKILHESGLSIPHSTRLGKDIQKSGLVLASAKRFRLKALSRAAVREWLKDVLITETATSTVSERSFVEEAIICIDHAAARAAIVLGWCAAIHRMRKKIESVGFAAFNTASAQLKSQSTGKYKRWNKEFALTTFGELQTTVFDTDLIIVLERMALIDGSQAQRLETCFEYRCHSAHPGEAPIGDPHVVAFFHDIVEMVLANPKFS